ncbi:hypothetical protein [Arthrobacter sp.]|uniref:hypothetical protein n=1 Tax=Arthrobacter sp. TaxID=1667 RepID=UPI00366CD3E6
MATKQRRAGAGAAACAAVRLGGCATAGPPATAVGSWELLDPVPIATDLATMRLGVTRLGCSGGAAGTVLEPTVDFDADRILIRANVAAGGGIHWRP